MSLGRRTTGSRPFHTKAFRLLTAPLRVHPDYLIIGAQRSGTTSLFEYLAQHPNVRGPLYKETSYFTKRWKLGPLYYRACFPTHAEMKSINDTQVITGEATPEYMWNPVAAKRIERVLPNVKLVAILRDPVVRAQSNYRLSVDAGVETLPFDEAIDRESERIRRLPNESDSAYFTRLEPLYFSYKNRGEYARQLKLVIDRFGRNRLHVMRFESMIEDPQLHFNRLLDFLDIPPSNEVKFDVYHKAGLEKNTEETNKTTAKLREYFAPHNDELAQIFGPEMTWKS